MARQTKRDIHRIKHLLRLMDMHTQGHTEIHTIKTHTHTHTHTATDACLQSLTQRTQTHTCTHTHTHTQRRSDKYKLPHTRRHKPHSLWAIVTRNGGGFFSTHLSGPIQVFLRHKHTHTQAHTDTHKHSAELHLFVL